MARVTALSSRHRKPLANTNLKSVSAATTELEPPSLEQRYHQALESNKAAREQYEGLLSQSLPKRAEPSRSPSTSLTTHLQLLRLRENNRKLSVLQAHTHSLNTLAHEHRIFDSEVPVRSSTSEQTNPDVPEHDLLSIKDTINSLTRSLELAVLQARAQLKREEALLAEVQARYAETDQDKASTQARLHALSATRHELTDWLEASLAQCSQDEGLARQEAPETTKSLEVYEELVDGQYAEYVAARKRLVAASQVLLQPLPAGTAVSKPSPAKSESNTASAPQLDTATLAYILHNFLPSRQFRNKLSETARYASTQLAQEREDTVDMLERLGDESQLLAAYPILARSERFKGTAASLGHKTEESEDEVLERVKAWEFAAGAAVTAMGANVEKQLEEGERAIEAFEESMQKVEEMVQVKKRL